MLTNRSVTTDFGFSAKRLLIAILSITGLLSLLLVSTKIYHSDSDYGKLLGYVLYSPDSIINHVSGDEQQNSPVIAIDSTYYDSDWDFKNIVYVLKDYSENEINFFATFYIEPENSFNYTSYYGFSPLRSPPLV